MRTDRWWWLRWLISCRHSCWGCQRSTLQPVEGKDWLHCYRCNAEFTALQYEEESCVRKGVEAAMTNDDGVKVVGYVGYNKARPKQRCFHWMPPKFTHKEQTPHHPLISALDEADAVNGYCPCKLGDSDSCVDENNLCDCDRGNTSECSWPLHDHADKLRRLKDGM